MGSFPEFHHAYDPCGSDGMLEGNGGGEGFAEQSLPRSNVSHRGNHQYIKSCANDQCQGDSTKKSAGAKIGVCFFRNFRDGFETSREIRNDLQGEKDR